MVIELMTNTHNHAYNNKNGFIKAWYLFASVNNDKGCIEITFVDTGEGIPVTVAKKMIEKIFTKKDNQYIISALNGDFRTQTHEKNRGKGLPDIYEHFNKNQIKNLKIISCKGKVELNDKNKIVEECKENNTKLTINFDGGYGYGTSFLEESFGGLVRKGYSSEELLKNIELISEEEPELIDKVIKYIKEAVYEKKN